MNTYEYILLIGGMSAVTFLPRMLPFTVLGNTVLSGFAARFLRYIPCAVLSALIVPAAFTSRAGAAPAAAGLAAAFILGRLRVHFLVSVFAAMAAAALVMQML